ncbi:MAG: hypothetical protein IJI26_02755 [Clostridia bacterium]|nr:hypothetical protein [Clostridia bacterium]
MGSLLWLFYNSLSGIGHSTLSVPASLGGIRERRRHKGKGKNDHEQH